MRIGRYRITRTPNTCGNCRLFEREKQDGKPTCVGYCSVKDKGDARACVPYRRQSATACRRLYSPLNDSLRHAGYRIRARANAEGGGYTAESDFDSCTLEAPTLTALYQLINMRYRGEA